MKAEVRQAVRKRLEDVSDVELMQWSFLVGLASRIETELILYAVLFSQSSELEPAPNPDLSQAQLLLANEVKRRSGAKTKLQKLPIETGGEEHANDVQANGSH